MSAAGQKPRLKWEKVLVILASPLLAVLSGLLLARSLSPQRGGAAAFGWFALAPLLVAVTHPRLDPRRPLYRFGLGLLAGTVAALCQVGVNPAAFRFSIALLPYLWIAMLIAIVTVFAASFRARFAGSGMRWMLAVAAAGVAVEWGSAFTPLPATIALSQSRAPAMLQIASVTGIWGVAFLLWLANAALADLVLRRRAALPSFTLAAFCALASLGFGLVRLHFVEGHSPRVTVAALQDFSAAEIPASELPAGLDPSPPDTQQLMQEASRRGARLMVTSEEALGAAFLPGRPDDSTAVFARESHAAIVPGFSQRIDIPGDDRLWNSAALIGPDGRTLGVYHKLFPFLGERQTVRPGGEHATAWQAPVGNVGMLICFDNCYTGPARDCVLAGAQIIAQPNFDPPVTRAVLHDLHAAVTPFRAVENGVAFVRADPGGFSQIVDPYGRIVAEAPLYRAEALVAPVAFGNGRGTFFTRWGDWFAYLCVTLTLAALLPMIKAASLRNRTQT